MTRAKVVRFELTQDRVGHSARIADSRDVPMATSLDHFVNRHCSLLAHSKHNAASGRASRRLGAISAPHRTHCP